MACATPDTTAVGARSRPPQLTTSQATSALLEATVLSALQSPQAADQEHTTQTQARSRLMDALTVSQVSTVVAPGAEAAALLTPLATATRATTVWPAHTHLRRQPPRPVTTLSRAQEAKPNVLQALTTPIQPNRLASHAWQASTAQATQ